MILCSKGKAEEALSRLREIMGKLKLTVNEEKTRICKVAEETFLGDVAAEDVWSWPSDPTGDSVLGYTFGRLYSPKTGQARASSTRSGDAGAGPIHPRSVRVLLYGYFGLVSLINLKYGGSWAKA